MGQRLQLHELLKAIMGSNPVYFQPPATLQMTYPCIVYSRARRDTKFADNRSYLDTKRYSVTVIDRDPDSPYPDQVSELPMSSHSTSFVADNLNHDVYDVYF